MKMTELLVNHSDIKAVAAKTRDASPGAGEVLLRIDSFALTANNMSYAAHGVDLAYWGFFPAPDGFGIVPVWGFATVVESRVDAILPGARFYGCWPMASHALVTPVKVSAYGFTDGAAHRGKLPPIYNVYVPASTVVGPEPIVSLFGSVYPPSFVLATMLGASPATTLVLTSASSKTAMMLAQAAKGRQRVVGMTSPGNRAFVAATGYYDRVVDYADAASLASEAGPVALVDFASNGAVRLAVHEALGDRLIERHVIGNTHWDTSKGDDLPGVTPRLFFGPSAVVKRIAEWGQAGFESRLAAAWTSFGASTGWLQIEHGAGPEAVITAWRALAAGDIDPAKGMVLTV